MAFFKQDERAKQEKEYFENFREIEGFKLENLENLPIDKWAKAGDRNGDGTLWRYLEYTEGGTPINQGMPLDKYCIWYCRNESLRAEATVVGEDGLFKGYAWDNRYNKAKNGSEDFGYEQIEDFYKAVLKEFKKIAEFANEGNFKEISRIANMSRRSPKEPDGRLFSFAVIWKIAYMYSGEKEPTILPITDDGAWSYFSKKYKLSATPDSDDRSCRKNRHIVQKALVEKKPADKTIYEWYVDLWNEWAAYDTYEPICELVNSYHNLVLTGAPGTGKTYMAKQVAYRLVHGGVFDCLPENKQKEFLESDNFKLVQFHPSYDYTDFVEGLRPVTDPDKTSVGGAAIGTQSKEIKFERKDGVFKAFCQKALKSFNEAEKEDDAPKYVFVIDEINRGEMSKIFGELFYCIDPGYRGPDGIIQTQYQNLITDPDDPFRNGFFIPKNVYIIGTMNDIDRSVDSMDFAMRRRFAWLEVTAADSAKNMDLPQESIQRMKSLNEAIDEIDGLNSAYHVGGAYFKKLDDNGDYNKLWNLFLKGLLAEYLRGMEDPLEKLEELHKAYNFIIPAELIRRIDLLNTSLKKDAVDLELKINKDLKIIYEGSKSKSKKLKAGFQNDEKIKENVEAIWAALEEKLKVKLADESLLKYKEIFISDEETENQD